eukprot:COSAG06_NODE_59890_length_272_cov_2.976879_1_plen_48_part_10
MPYFNPVDSTGFDVSRVQLPIPDYRELPDSQAIEQLQELGQTLDRVMQ